MKETDPAKYVSSWMEQSARDAPAAALLDLFETAWGALWRRAESAVGEIVLESIAELVRSNSVERYPFLSPLALGAADVSCKALLESASPPEKSELQEGLRFMLVDFLTVIGDLTDQILTPGLQDELSRIAPGSNIRRSAQHKKKPPESRIVPEEKKEHEDPALTAKDLVSTGIHNLETMLAGGLIKGSCTVIAGPSGSGKTILAQQIAFHNATTGNQALYFSTLSEPGAKTLFYLNKFSYSNPKKIGKCIHFVDLGILLRTKGLPQTLEIIVEHVKKLKPAFVVVDSFKVFENMAASPGELRKFAYELAVNLMAWRCTSLLLGEYEEKYFESNPFFAITDGLIALAQRELSGEQQRFIRVVKMRGLAHSRDFHTFRITAGGIEVFAPRFESRRGAPPEPSRGKTPYTHVGIRKLDDLMGKGIPSGSSLLIAGASGTGKTILGLEFLYRGALAGEKGIIFSFEETSERLRAAARGLGWDIDAEIARGMVEIVFIPQPDILVESDLVMMREKISAMGAARVVLDSLSVFLHKITDQQILRDKVSRHLIAIATLEAS